MPEPTLSVPEAQAIVDTKTAPKVTVQSMKDRIGCVEYLHPTVNPQLTIAVITMKNGFTVIGKSAPASPENFDPEVGKTYAFEDAFRTLWQLEGYLLRERLHQLPSAVDAGEATS